MNLFKLKKDGKTVGYMKFDGAKPLYQKYPFEAWHGNNEFTPLLCNCKITELSILPYVCDDKNGDKVFAGDTLQSTRKIGDRTLNGRPPSKNSTLRRMYGTTTVVFHDGGYYIKKRSKRGLKYPLNSLAVRYLQLELIKEKP
ncbi:hypothetical protein LCGC14_0346310 [marine sediment metagenome]|uniref:YopX protein domain-containing protein n=1 Tax=marine sediment metagenome TaxID=412755 RepID=A0A0F9THZ1_9ZZZZ